MFISVIIIIIACNNIQPTQQFTDTMNETGDMPLPPPIESTDIHSPPSTHPANLQQADVMVKHYAANKDGDIDKLVVQNGSDSLVLHFPPHTAKQVLAITAKHAVIHVEYDENKKPVPNGDAYKNQYGLISLYSKTNNKILNVHDVPPPPPQAGNEIIVSGNKIEWQNKDGHIGNFILSGRLIALPPHAVENLLPLLSKAHAIRIKGFERNANDGHVNINGLVMVRPGIITIDNVNYVVR